MPARTELDRLTAARPAVLHRTEDVVDPAAEDAILHHILTSAPDVPVLDDAGSPARLGGIPRPAWARPDGRTQPPRHRPVGRMPRRLVLGLTAAAAVIAAVALTLTMLTPAAHRPGHPAGGTRLTAWTVTKLTGGNVKVQLFQLRDQAGLQRKLRADGLPASVINLAAPNPACRPHPASQALLNKVFPGSYQVAPPLGDIVIHPAALPHDAGIQLAAQFGQAQGAIKAPILVYTSPRCTGS